MEVHERFCVLRLYWLDDLLRDRDGLSEELCFDVRDEHPMRRKMFSHGPSGPGIADLVAGQTLNRHRHRRCPR